MLKPHTGTDVDPKRAFQSLYQPRPRVRDPVLAYGDEDSSDATRVRQVCLWLDLEDTYETSCVKTISRDVTCQAGESRNKI